MSSEINTKGKLVSIPFTQQPVSFRSKAVEEIMLKKPDFLSRFALLFFILVILFLLAGMSFIRFSTNITLPAVVVADNSLSGDYTAQKFVAYAQVDDRELHNLKKGQPVTLDFPLYASIFIKGYISNISTLKGVNKSLLKIELPPGPAPIHNSSFQYTEGLSANVQVNNGTTSLLNYFLNKK